MCFVIDKINSEKKKAYKDIPCWKTLYPGCLSVVRDFNYRPNRLYKIKKTADN